MFMSDKPLLSWVAVLMPGNHLACGDELVVNDRTLLFVSLLPFDFLFFYFSTLQRAHTKHEGGTGAICTTALLTHFHLKKWSRI